MENFKGDEVMWVFHCGDRFNILFADDTLGIAVSDFRPNGSVATNTVKKNPIRRDARLLAVALGFKLGT